MATIKNITMKQFNGTDYDTLYPKTKVEQIENLTPSSIGAVSKTGDTMTGNLNITNSNPYLKLVETDSQEEYLVQVHQGDFYIGSQSHGPINGLVLKPDGTVLAKALYTVLHTGNAQSLGFSKIATGSYAGTGTYGSDNPCSLTFDFIPKFIIFTNLKADNGKCLNTLDNTAYIMLNTQVLTTAYVEGTGFGYEGRRRPYGAKSEDGKTIYWWNQDAGGQFNHQNFTYYWVAFG